MITARQLAPALGLAAAMALAAPARATVVGPPSVTNSAPPFNGSYVAGNTVNGNEAEYASAGQGAATFIEYDFGSMVEFDRVIMVNRNSGAGDDRFSQVTLTYDAGSDTIATNPNQLESDIYSVGFTRTQTVRWDVDAQAAAGPFNNTGMTEIIFLDTPTRSVTSTGVTAYNSAPPFNGSYVAANAVDGTIGWTANNAEYASATQGANMFIDFDLGAVTPISGFDLIDRIPAVDQYSSFDLIFANDAGFASPVATLSYGKAGLTASDVFDPINARYVRVDVTAGSGNTGLSEMIFYERNVITPTVLPPGAEEFPSGTRYIVEHLFDEQLDGAGADWASIGDDATTFTVDFGQQVSIDGINFANRRDSGNAPADFVDTLTLIFSDDLVFDALDATVTINPLLDNELHAYLFGPHLARYVQLTFTGRLDIPGNVGGAQLHFFAVTVPAPAALPAGLALMALVSVRRRR